MPENAKGALFKNKEKQGSQPDYTGNIELTSEFLQALLKEAGNGTYKARIAGWIKEGKGGAAFLSLSLNAPFDKGGKTTGKRTDEPPF